MSQTLVVVEKHGQTNRIELAAGDEHTITSDGPVAVTILAGNE